MVPCWRRLVHYTPAACDPPTAGVRLPSPLVQAFVIGALSESRKGEGNEEGDQLEFVHLSKETIPRKETSEVDEKLHPVNWYRPACRTGSLFGAGPNRQHLRQTIEHAGEKNSIPTDYCSVTYLYSERRPTANLAPPPLQKRAVNDLQEVVFPAWWQTPIYAWSFDHASLT